MDLAVFGAVRGDGARADVGLEFVEAVGYDLFWERRRGLC